MAQTSAKELKARRMGVFSLNSPWDPEKVDSRGAVMPKSGEQVPVDFVRQNGRKGRTVSRVTTGLQGFSGPGEWRQLEGWRDERHQMSEG